MLKTFFHKHIGHEDIKALSDYEANLIHDVINNIYPLSKEEEMDLEKPEYLSYIAYTYDDSKAEGEQI